MERELKDMYMKNLDEVAKQAKKLKSKKQAVKAVAIGNKKRPIQEDKKKTNEFFRAELIKCKPERFQGTLWGGFHGVEYVKGQKAIKFEMLNEVEELLRRTAARLVDGTLEDISVSEDDSYTPEHVTRIRNASWTWQLGPHPIEDPNDLENLSDMDCLAINLALSN